MNGAVAYYHGSKVVVKYMKTDAADQASIPQALHLLHLELQIVKLLRHPNIVDFIGSIVNFPGPGQMATSNNVGMMFEFWWVRY